MVEQKDHDLESAISSLESQTRSSEIGRFARRGFRRGLFTLKDIASRVGFVEQKLKQNFVAKHEIGHARIARRFGWFIHQINIVGNAFCRGFVKISPPPGQAAEDIIRQGAIISLGGMAATKSDEGTGSDFAKFNDSHQLAKVYNFKPRMGSMMEHQIIASDSVGSDSSLDNEAMDLLLQAA